MGVGRRGERRDSPVDLIDLHPVLLRQVRKLGLQLAGFLENGSLVFVNRFPKRVEDLDLIFVAESDWKSRKRRERCGGQDEGGERR